MGGMLSALVSLAWAVDREAKAEQQGSGSGA